MYGKHSIQPQAVHPEPAAVPVQTAVLLTTPVPPTAPTQAKCCDPCDCKPNSSGNFPLGFGIYGCICLVLAIIMFGLDVALAVALQNITIAGGFWGALIGILASSLACSGMGPPPKRGVVIACSVFSTIGWIICCGAAALDGTVLRYLAWIESICFIFTSLIDDEELNNVCDYIHYLYSLCCASVAFDILNVLALICLSIMTYVSLCCSSRICACCGKR